MRPRRQFLTFLLIANPEFPFAEHLTVNPIPYAFILIYHIEALSIA